MSQHLATGSPNARDMLRPTMLRYVVLKCCDRLAGACKCWANNVWICCDRLVGALKVHYVLANHLVRPEHTLHVRSDSNPRTNEINMAETPVNKNECSGSICDVIVVL